MKKCIFDAETCGYSHGSEYDEGSNKTLNLDFECSHCENAFASRAELMKHLKKDHRKIK